MKKFILVFLFFAASGQALSVGGALALSYLFSTCQKSCEEQQKEKLASADETISHQCQKACSNSLRIDAHKKGRKILQPEPLRQRMENR